MWLLSPRPPFPIIAETNDPATQAVGPSLSEARTTASAEPTIRLAGRAAPRRAESAARAGAEPVGDPGGAIRTPFPGGGERSTPCRPGSARSSARVRPIERNCPVLAPSRSVHTFKDVRRRSAQLGVPLRAARKKSVAIGRNRLYKHRRASSWHLTVTNRHCVGWFSNRPFGRSMAQRGMGARARENGRWNELMKQRD